MNGTLALGLLAALVINNALCIYTAYAKLPALENSLDRCSIITLNLQLSKTAGVIGRLFRQMIIWNAIIEKEKLHKRGLVDKEQILSIPRATWLWIHLTQSANVALGIAMFLILIIVKVLD